MHFGVSIHVLTTGMFIDSDIDQLISADAPPNLVSRN